METQQFLKKVIDNLLQYSYSKDRMSKKHISDLSEIKRKMLSLMIKEYEEEKSKISLESQQERNELLKKYTAKESKINDETYTKIQQTEMKELSAPYISKHIHLIYEYVAEYIFNHLEEDLTDPQKISSALKPILDLNLKVIIKDYLEEYMMIYTRINEGFQYVIVLKRLIIFYL